MFTLTKTRARELSRMWMKGETPLAAIIEASGCKTRKTLARAITEHNLPIPTRRDPKTTDNIVLEAEAALILKGKKGPFRVADLAKKAKLSRTTTWRAAKRLGIPLSR